MKAFIVLPMTRRRKTGKYWAIYENIANAIPRMGQPGINVGDIQKKSKASHSPVYTFLLRNREDLQMIREGSAKLYSWKVPEPKWRERG
jgi:hypothetical protein